MKNILYSCLMVAAMMFSSSLFAQPTPTDVTPGAKGMLTRPNAPIAPAKTIPGLYLCEACYYPPSGFLSGGHYQYRIYAPSLYKLGAESYDLQYLSGGEWNTVHREWTLDFYDINVGSSYDTKYGDYRMKINGGAYDGYVTNAVNISNLISRQNMWINGYYWRGSQWEMPLIGDRLQPIDVNVDYLSYDENDKLQREGHHFMRDPYAPDADEIKLLGDDVTFGWYRRNPYTTELTPVEGNADSTYTVKAEDWGYEICFVLKDRFEESFRFEMVTKTPVSSPVDCHFSYQNTDGFIINTAYELPSLDKPFAISYYGDEGNAVFDDYTVSQLAPGTYAVRFGSPAPEYFEMNLDQKRYDYAKLTYYYSFMESYDINHPQSSHQSVNYNFMLQPFRLKVTMDGKEVTDATIIASRKNLSGEVEEKTLSADDTDLYKGEYLIRASAPGSRVTYYQRTVNPDQAEKVVVPCKVGEGDWWMLEDKEYVLDLIPETEDAIIDHTTDAVSGKKYDLMGREIIGNYSGVYIQNGKKVIR